MALVHDGRAHAVNGSGRAARALPPDAVRGGVAIRGVGAITVPGAVAAWRTLAELGSMHAFAARSKCRRVRAGAFGATLGRSLAADPGLIAADEGLSAVFAPGGRVLGEGDLLVQERLGRTLQRLAAQGTDDLYRGETAARLIAGLRERGSQLSLADLDAHRTDVEPVLRRTIGDEDVLTMGANSQGFSLPQILAAVDHMELRDPLATDAPLLAAIFRESARDRDRYLADPAAMERPVEELLSEAHIAGLAARAAAASAGPVARPHADGDTIALVAADGSGLAVSLIQSIYFGFGSGVLEPDTGILLHNRGACFSADPDSPNALGGQAAAAHADAGRADARRAGAWVAGTMGGHAQAQIHAQMLLRRPQSRRRPGDRRLLAPLRRRRARGRGYGRGLPRGGLHRGTGRVREGRARSRCAHAPVGRLGGARACDRRAAGRQLRRSLRSPRRRRGVTRDRRGRRQASRGGARRGRAGAARARGRRPRRRRRHRRPRRRAGLPGAAAGRPR